MITVAEADTLLERHVRALPPAARPLAAAVGEVLAEPIRADRPLPPYDRVAMDGVAVRYAALQTGARSFAIIGQQRAGQPAADLPDDAACIEVMTGAVLPHGADCVVPLEDVDVDGGAAHVRAARVRHRMNVHGCGSDRAAGDVLIEPGVRLTAAHIGIAAAVGMPVLQVAARPSIALVSTGDELVDVQDEPAGHQIRRSNGAAVRAALLQRGFGDVSELHVPDDERRLRTSLAALIDEVDVLILSGGVSRGRYDFVPAVLQSLGVVCRFHGIRQKPGKPLWFGTTPGGRPVFGLPGNPVSALVCTFRYVLPALQRACGAAPAAPVPAVLAADVPAPGGDATLYAPAAVATQDGRLYARPLAGNGSGDFCALAAADGFVEVRAATAMAGSVVAFHDWRT